MELHFEEMELERVTYDSKGRRRSTTVFKGAIILLSFNKDFKGKTIVKKDKGRVGNYLSKPSSMFSDMERVHLEDPEFEKMFEVYSEDQIESRYLLTTSFMERLKRLNDFFDSKKFEAGFCDNELFLMFNKSKNLFETSSIFQEVNLVRESKIVLEQMGLIFDIVEILRLNERLVAE